MPDPAAPFAARRESRGVRVQRRPSGCRHCSQASLIRGGNATGVSLLQLDLASKRVELLKETAPSVSHVAILANPDHPGVGSELKVTRQAAKSLDLATELFEPVSDATFPLALDAVVASKSDAVLTFPDALSYSIVRRSQRRHCAAEQPRSSAGRLTRKQAA